MFYAGSSLFANEIDESDPVNVTAYAEALAAYVNDDGDVDYAGLQQNPAQLNAYLDSIAQLDPEIYESWSNNRRIAFWCNAYNAYTLKVIIDNFPIQPSLIGRLRFPPNSIRQITGVWNRLRWQVMGREMTLDEMEHETLRKNYREPRIHFAVNCASVGCPVLRNEPYVAERLEEQFIDQIQRFIQRPLDYRLDHSAGRVHLSRILQWYGEDFLAFAADNLERFAYLNQTERGVMNFLYPYLPEVDQTYLDNNQITISYIDYDWSLNQQNQETSQN